MKITTTYALRATVAAAALSLCGMASAIDLNANIEFDNTFRSGNVTKGTSDEGLTQGGRVEFNASGKAGSNYFFAGKASFLANRNRTATVDDMWAQVGSAAGDVKLGSFEAIDLFPVSQDTVVNHAAPVYYTNTLRGRFSDTRFHGAGTLNLSKELSLELGLVETKTAGSAKGFRPAINYAAGPLSLKAGIESGKNVGGGKFNGVGGSAGYDLGVALLTGNFASGKTSTGVAGVPDVKTTSFGLNAKAGGLFGGVIFGNTDLGSGPKVKVTTFHASYALPLFDIKGATVTPALSVSKAKDVLDTTTLLRGDKDDTSVRVRLNYAF